MKFSAFKIYMFLLAVGFVLIALDIDVTTGMKYPHAYQNTDQVIGEFQYYNIASNYNARCTYKMLDNTKGSENKQPLTSNPGLNANVTMDSIKVIDKIYFKNIKVDIASDFVGFLFIAIACFGFRKVSRRFRLAMTTAVFAFILHGIVAWLPFAFNGLLLCNIAMVMGIAYLFCSVLTTFLFASGLLTMCPGVWCRDERKWCKLLWFITFVLQILVTFIFWLGSDFSMLHNLGIFFEYFLVFIIVVFWIVLHRTHEYMEETYHQSLSSNK